MEILYVLETLRTPVLNRLMLLVTTLGEETAFLVAAMIVFWCVDKKKGYYVMAVGFLGTLLNQFLKLTFQEPRPWVKDPQFTIVEQAREAAVGFSFPSGHSTSSVCTFGAIGVAADQRWVKWICAAICVLVPVSRMYIGVHTPLDVLAGALLALVLIFVLRPIRHGVSDRTMTDIMMLMLLLCGALLVYSTWYPFEIPADQLHNLHSGCKNAYTMLGAIGGMLMVYPLEKKYVKFETKAVWWAQILKVLLGFAVVIVVKEGLRAPLEVLFRGHMAARSVRYFLIVVTAGLLWPMTFRWFSKLGAKE